MRDLKNNVTEVTLMAARKFAGSLEETDVAADGSLTGTAVDLKGEGRKCLVLVSIGTTATATANIIIQQSDDNSTFATKQEVIADTAGLQVFDLATSRYIRAYATLSATAEIPTHSYVNACVVVLVYNERYIPSNVA